MILRLHRTLHLRQRAAATLILTAALTWAAGANAQTATAGTSAPPDSAAAESNTEIAKKLQNPVADLISVPLQSNTNFGFGPENGTQEVLNIQPVIPFHLNDDWNLITRTIMPLTWNPALTPDGDSSFGLGNTTESLFLSPAHPGKWIWGVGPVILLPATNGSVGSNLWGAGPSAVALRMDGPWVYGALISNVWTFGGESGLGGNKINLMTLQPFINYNFGGGWYLTTSPIITSNWEADPGERLTLPIGGGLGKVFRLGRLPVNVSLQGYYNAVRPDNGADWQLRSQLTFIF
jgi:hypothetical protein